MTALGRRSMKTSCRNFPGVSTSTTMKPRTRTVVPTRKYKMVASAPLKTGLRSMVPNSTARYMTVSFSLLRVLRSVRDHLVPPGPPVLPPEPRDGDPGSTPGLHRADAARVCAVGADRHDGVVVAQVLGAGVVGARRGALVAGERVGHLGGRSRAQIPGAAGIA